MADVTKTVKFLLLGDATGASAALKGLSGDMSKVGKASALKILGADLRNAIKSGEGMKGVGAAFKKAGADMGGVGGIAKTVGVGMAAAGAAGVAAGAAIAVKFGADSVAAFQKVGAEVRNLSRLTGLTAEDASRMNFAFKETGIDGATGAKSVGQLEKNLVKAAGSSKTAAAMAKTLGFSFTDASGKVKPMSELMPKLADKFASMPDGAGKTALAMKLFGKSGSQLLPFLNKGAVGLKELADESDKTGNTMSGKSLDALKANKEEQKKYDAAMQGLQVTLGSKLLPIMTQAAQFVNSVAVPAIEGMTEWVNKNQGAFDALGNMMRWVWNNVLLPALKLAVTGFIEMNKPLAQGVILLGQLTGNKDMVKFGQGVLDAANDVEGFVNGLKSIPDKVAPKVALKDDATTRVKQIDTMIKSVKDKIVTAKAKGDDQGVRDLKAKLAALEREKHIVKVSAELTKGKFGSIKFVAGKGNGLNAIAVARGGILKPFATGGIEDHQPKIYRPLDGARLFNEPETRGESYIPLANDWRRPRAVAVWRETGRELGVYAAGGLRGAQAGAGGVRDITINLNVKVPPGGEAAAARAIRDMLVKLNVRQFGGRGLGIA